jgi:hypothetical protein
MRDNPKKLPPSHRPLLHIPPNPFNPNSKPHPRLNGHALPANRQKLAIKLKALRITNSNKFVIKGLK